MWVNRIGRGDVGRVCEYRIAVNMSNFQFEDAGSIPATCNKP